MNWGEILAWSGIVTGGTGGVVTIGSLGALALNGIAPAWYFDFDEDKIIYNCVKFGLIPLLASVVLFKGAGAIKEYESKQKAPEANEVFVPADDKVAFSNSVCWAEANNRSKGVQGVLRNKVQKLK